jgi:hypothetical protein
MHEQVGRDPQTADLERLARVALDELHLGRHVIQPDREVSGVHLVRECGLQRLGRARWAHYRQVRARRERR